MVTGSASPRSDAKKVRKHSGEQAPPSGGTCPLLQGEPAPSREVARTEVMRFSQKERELQSATVISASGEAVPSPIPPQPDC